MHSIQIRITTLTILAILISTLSFGLISLFSIRQESLKSSVEKLNLICENRKDALNEYLSSIQQSVDMISRSTTESLDVVTLVEGGVIGADGSTIKPIPGRTKQQKQELDDYLRKHTRSIRSIFRNVANHTNGIVAYYYRVNPEISTAEKGFFFSKAGQSDFEEAKMTDLSAYDPTDVEHVIWYYAPLQAGRPIWTPPYYNANLNVHMLSYATPIYKGGTFIGVIGMDIRYDTLVSQIEQMSIYQNGFFCLLEANGTILHHPEYEMGTQLREVIPSLNEFTDSLSAENAGKQLFEYNNGTQSRQLTFTTLKNGLKLICVVPSSEINASWYRLLSILLPTTIIILVAFIIITFVMCKRLTDPLKRLTDASKRLADGDYDVELSYDGDNEVGILTQSFASMRDHLKSHISDLNSKVYKDALTGIRNKGAFDQMAEQLDAGMHTPDPDVPLEFAVINFDCDFLKRINDEHGHEKGDLYLRTASQLICRIFAHSPVFRVGGDEFAAILQGEDFKNRETLMLQFDESAAAINASTAEPWLQVYISKGMAIYSPDLDADIKSVIRRADVLMYEDKKKNHSIRE